MSIILTIYLAGMPCALAVLIWALWGLEGDDDTADTVSGIAAAVVFVLGWPVFLFLAIKDAITER